MRFAGFIDRNFDEISECADTIDERIVPIDLRKLATVVLRQRLNEQSVCIEVGQSAKDITRYWPKDIMTTKQSITVIEDSRRREERVLEAENLPLVGTSCYFVDDVAVSGRTLEIARTAVAGIGDQSALIGMAWNSRRLKRRINMPLKAGITYSQSGGGIPAINSISTFARRQDVREDYAMRRFRDLSALDAVIKLYEESEK